MVLDFEKRQNLILVVFKENHRPARKLPDVSVIRCWIKKRQNSIQFLKVPNDFTMLVIKKT